MKKLLKGIVIGASVLAMAGTAAADININLYGASAQHKFWNALADDFLTSRGCTNVVQDQFDGKNGITRGTCSGEAVYIRYSSKASFDGILALKGDKSMAGTAEICNEGDPGVPAGRSGFYRKMVDETSCPWDGTGGTNCSSLKCVDVTLGASDVAGEAFTQSSSGQLKGPLGGGAVSRSFSGINTAGLNVYNPLMVPFGFFANNTIQKCSSWPHGAASCAGTWETIGNVSREMAVMIFSGQAYLWADFGQDYRVNGTRADIVACMRHAGSGTQATLDYAVMQGNGWGTTIYPTESTAGPIVYFNDGSSDMMNCINGSGAWNGHGAIGYADADQTVPGNSVALAYNGEKPSRVSIRNGRYDFWSKQFIYEDPNEPGYNTLHPWHVNLISYASDPDNLTVAVLGAAANFWATDNEMVYMKASDRAYPGYRGASEPQTP